MTTTRNYQSTDGGAPVLTGQNSKMIDLLDAVLVNGYNTQTITITRSGDTATAACTAHGYVVDQVVLISGATPSAYNGEFRVLTAAANDFTFEVLGTPTTPATGTISCKVAPAGWTKPYTGTDKAAFRNSLAAGGSGMYLRVLDDASATGGARDAKAWVYSAMSDVDTGSDITPGAGQMANGVFFRKSSTADSTARPWRIWADELTCYVWVEPVTSGTFTTQQNYLYGFGDFTTILGSDGYNFFIAGNTTTAASTAQQDGSHIGYAAAWVSSTWAPKTDPTGLYCPKRYQQDTGPIAISSWALSFNGGASLSGFAYGTANSPTAWPDPGSGLKTFSAMYVVEPNCIRGQFRGLYAPYGDVLATAPAATARETSIVGLPAGAALDVVRNDISISNSKRGFLAIEALLPWS